MRNTGNGRGRDDNLEMYGRSTTASVHGGEQSKIGSEESIILRQGVQEDSITKTTHITVSVDEQSPRNPRSLV